MSGTPISAQQGLGLYGLDARNKQERGVVLDVFPDTFTALVNLSDGPRVCYIPSRTPIDPDNPAGTFELPYRNSEVLVSRVDGMAFILGYLPPRTQVDMGEDKDRRQKILPDDIGSSSTHYANKGGIRTSGIKPNGLLPGDWGIAGKFGNMLAILDGGVNLLRSHEQAQIATFLREQLVKIIARRYKLFSDFGSVEHTSDETGASLKLRGAAGVAANSASDTWTIRADLGASGGLVNLRVTDETGFELSQLKVDPVGNVYYLAKKMTGDVLGNLRTKIRGAVDTTVEGVASVMFKNTLDLSVGNKLTSKLGGVDTLVSGSSYTHVNDKCDLDVGGASSAVLNEGLTLETPNGDLTVRVGEDANASLTISNKNGKIDINITEAGDINISTASGAVTISGTEKIVLNTNSAPDSVKLGSDGVGSNVVTYDGLHNFLSLIMGMLDSHTHKDPTNTTTITGAPSSAAYSGMLVALDAAKSISAMA